MKKLLHDVQSLMQTNKYLSGTYEDDTNIKGFQKYIFDPFYSQRQQFRQKYLE